MENEFQVKFKQEKDLKWLKDFVVGEEVIVDTNYTCYSKRNPHRKGIITRIGKTISVNIIDFDDVGIRNPHQMYFTNKIIYKQNIRKSTIVRERNAIHKRGEKHDEYFNDFTYDW
jgi:hypothetical protein